MSQPGNPLAIFPVAARTTISRSMLDLSNGNDAASPGSVKSRKTS